MPAESRPTGFRTVLVLYRSHYVIRVIGLLRSQADSLVTGRSVYRDFGPSPVPAQHNGRHDFDFELGTWKMRLKVLGHSPKGGATWVEYEGTSVVHSIWEGRANMVELEVDGPTGHPEAINLRLYNPTAHQWSLNFANATQGVIPAILDF